MDRKSRVFAFVMFLAACEATDDASRAAVVLTEADAIGRAERFLVAQGYTTGAPTQPIRRESVQRVSDSEAFKMRRNTLEAKACGAVQSTTGLWMVGFRHVEGPSDVVGRVTVERDGSVRMEHQDAPAALLCSDVPTPRAQQGADEGARK